MHPKTPIYHLNIWGKVASAKTKKRKINLCKSIDEDTKSCMPSILGPFEEIMVEIWLIKKLESQLPRGRERLPPPVISMLRNLIMRNT